MAFQVKFCKPVINRNNMAQKSSLFAYCFTGPEVDLEPVFIDQFKFILAQEFKQWRPETAIYTIFARFIFAYVQNLLLF